MSLAIVTVNRNVRIPIPEATMAKMLQTRRFDRPWQTHIVQLFMDTTVSEFFDFCRNNGIAFQAAKDYYYTYIHDNYPKKELIDAFTLKA